MGLRVVRFSIRSDEVLRGSLETITSAEIPPAVMPFSFSASSSLRSLEDMFEMRLARRGEAKNFSFIVLSPSPLLSDKNRIINLQSFVNESVVFVPHRSLIDSVPYQRWAVIKAFLTQS